MPTFIVKLRSLSTKSWGNQEEVEAGSALEAAQRVSGETLRQGAGERDRLRAKVWATPFGTQPEVQFYLDGPA